MQPLLRLLWSSFLTSFQNSPSQVALHSTVLRPPRRARCSPGVPIMLNERERMRLAETLVASSVTPFYPAKLRLSPAGMNVQVPFRTWPLTLGRTGGKLAPNDVTPDLFRTPVRCARMLCFTSPPCVPGAHEALPDSSGRPADRPGQRLALPLRPPATRTLPRCDAAFGELAVHAPRKAGF